MDLGGGGRERERLQAQASGGGEMQPLEEPAESRVKRAMRVVFSVPMRPGLGGSTRRRAVLRRGYPRARIYTFGRGNFGPTVEDAARLVRRSAGGRRARLVSTALLGGGVAGTQPPCWSLHKPGVRPHVQARLLTPRAPPPRREGERAGEAFQAGFGLPSSEGGRHSALRRLHVA